MKSAVSAPTTEEALIEKLRGQLAAALSLLLSLGFDYVDLMDFVS